MSHEIRPLAALIIYSKTVSNFSIAEHLGIDKKLPVEEIIEKLQVQFVYIIFHLVLMCNKISNVKKNRVCVWSEFLTLYNYISIH